MGPLARRRFRRKLKAAKPWATNRQLDQETRELVALLKLQRSRLRLFWGSSRALRLKIREPLDVASRTRN